MADPVFTLSNILKQNLGGGCWVVGGMLTADTGTYVAGGHATTPAFNTLDPVGNREPDIVIFRDADGYLWHYDDANSKLQLYAITCDGNALVNGPFTEHSAVALAGAVGADAGFTAFWFPTWNEATGGE
ncbi:MAG: hypothetical protein ACW99U_18175 [Candidatus Thorarchaeota archaeon]|jgi:hypothetical protein